MKTLKKLLLVLLMLVLALFAVSCGGDDEEEEDDTPKGTRVLNVYNWGEYISDGFEGSYDTVAEFEKWYNSTHTDKVKVIYTTYATNEDMYAKITSGAGSYDVIVPSDYMIQRLAEEGLLIPLNYDLIPNAQYIEDEFKGKYYDPDAKYSIAYTYGKVGVIYNTTMVDEEDVEDQSWGLLWNEKYAGQILQFNNPRDGFGSAQYYKNIDVNSNDPADWQRALEIMKEQRPLVQGYVADEIFNKMETGSAAIAAYYAGDFLIMAEDNEYLDFYYPKEGTNIFVDAMCIPACSKPENRDLACIFINFMLSEEAAIANAEYIGYACPNTLVTENEDYADDMGEYAMEILYGGDDTTEYSFDPYYHSFTPEIQALVNSLWEELKTETETELWVHIVSALIVVSVVGYAIFSVVREKKRASHYRGAKNH